MRERISDIFKEIESIEIDYQTMYKSAFGDFINKHTAKYLADFVCSFDIKCTNDDCTAGEYDLYNEVSSMYEHKEVTRQGIKECQGNEARDHSNKCPSTLEYTIRIKYLNRDGLQK